MLLLGVSYLYHESVLLMMECNIGVIIGPNDTSSLLNVRSEHLGQSTYLFIVFDGCITSSEFLSQHEEPEQRSRAQGTP